MSEFVVVQCDSPVVKTTELPPGNLTLRQLAMGEEKLQMLRKDLAPQASWSDISRDVLDRVFDDAVTVPQGQEYLFLKRYATMPGTGTVLSTAIRGATFVRESQARAVSPVVDHYYSPIPEFVEDTQRTGYTDDDVEEADEEEEDDEQAEEEEPQATKATKTKKKSTKAKNEKDNMVHALAESLVMLNGTLAGFIKIQQVTNTTNTNTLASFMKVQGTNTNTSAAPKIGGLQPTHTKSKRQIPEGSIESGEDTKSKSLKSKKSKKHSSKKDETDSDDTSSQSSTSTKSAVTDSESEKDCARSIKHRTKRFAKATQHTDKGHFYAELCEKYGPTKTQEKWNTEVTNARLAYGTSQGPINKRDEAEMKFSLTLIEQSCRILSSCKCGPTVRRPIHQQLQGIIERFMLILVKLQVGARNGATAVTTFEDNLIKEKKKKVNGKAKFLDYETIIADTKRAAQKTEENPRRGNGNFRGRSPGRNFGGQYAPHPRYQSPHQYYPPAHEAQYHQHQPAHQPPREAPAYNAPHQTAPPSGRGRGGYQQRQ